MCRALYLAMLRVLLQVQYSLEVTHCSLGGNHAAKQYWELNMGHLHAEHVPQQLNHLRSVCCSG